MKYVIPLIPYSVGMAILLAQSNFHRILYLNLLFQSILFLFVVCIPIYRTRRMSYVDIAWPWGLVIIGIVNYTFNEGSELMLLISTFMILYFFFNLLSGQRGLISYFEKKQILNDLKKDESQIISQIKDLDFKNSLLSDNLDLDYIETLIRERFLFGKKNEQIYIIKNNDTKN